MAGTIRITPEELREAATFLQSRMDAITNEANSLKSKLDDIGDRWEGEAKTAFYDEFNTDMWPVLNEKLPELITAVMSQLTETAKVMEDTDTQIAGAMRGQAAV